MTMTMIDYNLDRGSIWEISYFTIDKVAIDPNIEQNMIDSQTREISYDTFNPPPGLSPAEYSVMFMNHFLKTRQESRKVVQESNKKLTRYIMLVQVGNKECFDNIIQIENSLDFEKWENASIVDLFKNVSQEYLNG